MVQVVTKQLEGFGGGAVIVHSPPWSITRWGVGFVVFNQGVEHIQGFLIAEPPFRLGALRPSGVSDLDTTAGNHGL